jgi:hypothetical protein
MSLESFDCPMCKRSKMKKGISRIKFQFVLDDGTTGDAKHPFLVCPVCNNIQIVSDVIKPSTLTLNYTHNNLIYLCSITIMSARRRTGCNHG